MSISMLDILEPLSQHLCPLSFSKLFAAHNAEVCRSLLANSESTFSRQECVKDLKRAGFHQNKLKYTMMEFTGNRIFHNKPELTIGEGWNSMQYYSAWQRFTKELESKPVIIYFAGTSGNPREFFSHHATDHYFKACQGKCSCISCTSTQYKLQVYLKKLQWEVSDNSYFWV